MMDFWNRRRLLGTAMAATVLAAAPLIRGAAGAATAARPAHITDAQVHIWLAGDKKPSASGRQAPLPAEELIATMDAAGVDRAVIVTPSWGSNDYSSQATEAYPGRLKVMGLAGMPKAEDQGRIEAMLAMPGMAGIRLFLSAPPGMEYLASGAGDWLWPFLETHKVPLMIHASGSIDKLGQIAAAHPGLRICLDSFGLPMSAHGADTAGAARPALALAAHPNIIVKAAAIPFLSGEAAPFADLDALVKETVDAFGADRVAFASDISLLRGPYAEALDYWTAQDWLTDADRALIMGGTIDRWLDWPVVA